jgi:hypothetical protein
MQNIDLDTASDTVVSEAIADAAETLDNAKAARKRVAKKLAAKRADTPTAPPAEAAPAKPTQAEREAAQRDRADQRALARQAASRAVAAFYTGSSKPFKSSGDKFSDLNHDNAKAPSQRQAGLMLALLTYGAGNMQADGTFVRGAFSVPASLVNANAKPGETVRAQPESGCLGNMLGRTVAYVSGPVTGRLQTETVLRLNVERALTEIQSFFGDAVATGAGAAFESYAKAA